MSRISPFVCLLLLPSLAVAEDFRSDVAPLIEASCVACHDATTETPLDFTAVKHDLADEQAFRSWERIYERVRRGEMPPETESAPNPMLVKRTLESLQHHLHAISLAAQQAQGRVPARRLTRTEYGYTVQDLLAINGDVTSSLPDEVESGTFETVGSHQRLSSVHLESYLGAADEQLIGIEFR